MEAIRIKHGWIICANCGRKLAKIDDATIYTKDGALKDTKVTKAVIQFKCPSCKKINVYEIREGEVNDKDNSR